MSSFRSNTDLPLFQDIPEAPRDAVSVEDVARERQRARRQERKQVKAHESQLKPARALEPPRGVISAPNEGQGPYIDVRALAARWGVGVSTIWRWAKDGTIPKPVQLGAGATRWVMAEIVQYEVACLERRS
jgi:prophage regulatory protein